MQNGGINKEQFRQHVLSSERDERDVTALMKALFPRGSEPEAQAKASQKDAGRPRADSKKNRAKTQAKKSKKKSPNERIAAASKDSSATRTNGAAAALKRMQINGGGQTKSSKDSQRSSSKSKSSKGAKVILLETLRFMSFRSSNLP